MIAAAGFHRSKSAQHAVKAALAPATEPGQVGAEGELVLVVGLSFLLAGAVQDCPD